jgi:hypothetical protein
VEIKNEMQVGGDTYLNSKKDTLLVSSLHIYGGAERDPTDDLLLARQAISQLSVRPRDLGDAPTGQQLNSSIN